MNCNQYIFRSYLLSTTNYRLTLSKLTMKQFMHLIINAIGTTRLGVKVVPTVA